MARTGRHLVVDGSNIATEGRTSPSLAQLDEAVQAIQAEHPEWTVTVIVDATFAHRIDTSERRTFEDASDNGEILMPPAGAVGRGDAFILQVAEKADAAVLSNDSFQEFHGTHTWLFDEGRLIGGKPVEGIGWIFVDRVPVRGPTSRRATREAATKSGKSGRASKKSGSKRASRSKPSKEAQGPPPVPSTDTPPPTARRRRGRSSTKADGDRSDNNDKNDSNDKNDKNDEGDTNQEGGATKRSAKSDRSAKSSSGARAPKRNDQREALNSPEDFLRFVTRYSIGEEAEAVVERFSSHGCYLRTAGAQCYLPVSAMGDPPPNRARDVVSQGQTAIVRVNSLDSDRRGINVELVRVVSDGSPQQNPPTGPSRRRGQSQTSQQPANVADDSAGEANPTRSDTTVATKKATKKSAAKKATKKATRKAAKKSPAKKAAKKVTKKSPAKATASSRAAKATAKKATKKATKKSAAKKAAKKTTKKATRKSPAKKATKKAAKKSPAKKAAKKTTKKAAKRSTAKKATKRS